MLKEGEVSGRMLYSFYNSSVMFLSSYHFFKNGLLIALCISPKVQRPLLGPLLGKYRFMEASFLNVHTYIL